MMNRDAKFFLRVVAIIIFFLAIGGYAFYQARKILNGPQITIDSPKNGSSTSEPLIDIKGTATNIQSISLNDRPIFIDREGHFEEKLLLPVGLAIITLKAEDRFGHKISKQLEVYYASSSPL